jgi:hypothetical protein
MGTTIPAPGTISANWCTTTATKMARSPCAGHAHEEAEGHEHRDQRAAHVHCHDGRARVHDLRHPVGQPYIQEAGGRTMCRTGTEEGGMFTWLPSRDRIITAKT